MPIQTAVFVTPDDLSSFERFVSIDGFDQHSRVVKALEVIGTAICKEAVSRGAKDVTYEPKPLLENLRTSPFLGQLNLSSPDPCKPTLEAAVATFVSDITTLRRISG